MKKKICMILVAVFVAVLGTSTYFTVPTDVPIVADSNVEMSWYTFTGEYSEIYESLMTAWCLEKEIEPTEENLSKYFKLHLERGIAYLSGTNFIKSIDDLLDLALKENQ